MARVSARRLVFMAVECPSKRLRARPRGAIPFRARRGSDSRYDRPDSPIACEDEKRRKASLGMIYRILADAVVALHLVVVVYIVAGGSLAWRWPRLALIHLPFAVWGVAIEIGGWICPLTPLENWLRRLG